MITQLSVGTYRNDLASYPDEAAHFISALCILDYVATAAGSNPVAFAQTYYTHFPRVAFGHWPPGFFVEQAAWYVVFGATPPAGMLLIGATAAAAALVLFASCRRFFDAWTAAAGVAVYLTIPIVRNGTTMLMPDLSVALLAFLAVRALADGCNSGGWRDWSACAAWSTALVLTKESGLVVLVFAPVAFLLFAGPQRWSRAALSFWSALALICLTVFVVYKGTGVLEMRGLPSPAGLPPLPIRIKYLRSFFGIVPWELLAVAGVGAIAAMWRRDPDVRRAVHVRCHAVWVVLWLAGQVFFRDFIEPRYFLPAVPSLIVVFAAGIDRLDRAMRKAISRWTTRGPAAAGAITPLAVALCCVALMPPTVTPRRHGYDAAIQALPRAREAQAVLISSDASGTGALIADLAARRRDHDVTAVRADKVLASSDWMGSRARLLASTPAAVVQVLDSIPVRYVIVDAHASIQEVDRAPNRLLHEAVESRPDQFRTVAELPLVVNGIEYRGALQVFENLAAGRAASAAIHIPSSALAGGRPPDRPAEWTLRSESTLRRDRAIADVIQAIADRLAPVLPLWPPHTQLPPLRPASDHLGPHGGAGETWVAPELWAQRIRSSDSWIRVVTDDAQSSGGLLRYVVAPNDSTHDRTGSIVVGQFTFSVSQSGGR